MAGVFDLDIITPEKELYRGKVESLIVPSETGYMGVLHDHAPLVGRVGKGNITIKKSGSGTVTLDSPGNGFLEISRNKVIILFS